MNSEEGTPSTLPGSTVPQEPSSPEQGIPPVPATPPAEPTIEELKAQLADLKQRQSGWSRHTRQLETEMAALKAQLQAGGSAAELRAIHKRLDKMEETDAKWKDRQTLGEPEGEASPPSYTQQLMERRQAEAKQADVEWESKVDNSRQTIQAVLDEYAAPGEILTQDAQFTALWKGGELIKAQARAVVLASQARQSAKPQSVSAPPGSPAEPDETEEERIARLADEKYRKTLRERGLLTVETGSSQGAGRLTTFTEAQLQDREFWKANRAAIQKAQEEGTFKIK